MPPILSGCCYRNCPGTTPRNTGFRRHRMPTASALSLCRQRRPRRREHFCIVETAHPDKRETIGDMLRKGKHLYISNPPYDCFPLPRRPLNQLQRIIWFSICRQLTSNQALLGLQGMLSCRPTNARLQHNQASFKIRRTLR